MSLFLCNHCKQIYEDDYPIDDCCLLCKKGTVRIVANKSNQPTLSEIFPVQGSLKCFTQNLKNSLIEDLNPKFE